MNSKRILEGSNLERPTKIPFDRVMMVDKTLEEKEFQFRVLLPNSTTIELKMNKLSNEIPMEKFLEIVRKEHDRLAKQWTPKSNRIIDWENQDLYLMDEQLKEIRYKINLSEFMPSKWHFLWLHDGSAETEVYEDAWDLNEKPNKLKKNPNEFRIETVLENHMDDSLHIMRLDGMGERRSISVELLPNTTSITNSGLGSDDIVGNNSIPIGDGGHKLGEGPSIIGALPTLRTPKLEQEDDIPTSSAIISQNKAGDDLLSTATTMLDHKRELERLQFIQSHIEYEIQQLQVESRPLFEKTPFAALLLMENKSKLELIKKQLDEENEAYRLATAKFLVARDKYNNLSRIASDTPIVEGPSHVPVNEEARNTPIWLSQFNFI